MSNLAAYVGAFFDELQMYEDVARGHSYKAYLRSAVDEFLANETQETAFGVYRAFFDSYRITMEGEREPFLDLLDVLRSYEQTAATLIDKQRDHYIHAVNVFLTGLCIYAHEPRYRQAFAAAVPEPGYAKSYQTAHEEFFYRWGVASLFHDVGYPVEIVGHQINKFISMVADADGDETRVRAQIRYENFDELNHIREVVPKRSFTKAYYDAYESCSYIDLLTPIDLLAHRVHQSLGTDLALTKQTIDGSVDAMAESGFVDHGYYSAIIVLKWYGYVIQQAGYAPEYFYWPVVDAATAIYLHNAYRNVFTKAPFGLGPMSASDNPLAWLLILCDELQEWNREARGIVTRTFTLAETVHLLLADGYLSATYLTGAGLLPAGFCAEKVELLRGLLALDEVFPQGFDVDNESREGLRVVGRPFEARGARPLLANLEALAIAIHERYNEQQLRRHPDRPLEYPRFSELPDDLKYSNLRQAQGIYDRLDRFGLRLGPAGGPGAIAAIPEELIEPMAADEHEDWMRERRSRGWTLGPRDASARTTPCLVPFDELPEDVRELDRDAIRNICDLVGGIGLAVYER